MPRVYIPALLRPLTGGLDQVEAEGSTVRQIVASLETAYPGMAARLTEDGRLRPNISVAVNDEISPLGLAEPVTADSEIHFVTAIRGGK